jgi:hypothetical protein
LISVPFEDPDAAFFACALLNSTPVRTLVRAYALELSLSSHLLDHVAVPHYSAVLPNHARLSTLARTAGGALAPGQLEMVEREVDSLAAELWGIPVDLTEDLRRYYEELPADDEGDTEAEDD